MTYDELFPSDRYELYPKVAVFKTHQRIKNGRVVKVDREALEKIAYTHNERLRRSHRASPFSKGHTLSSSDGEEIPEEDQPDICGYGVRFYVDKLEEEPEEDYLFCDLYLKKKEKEVLEDWPAISPEYMPSRSLLYPIAFLKSSPPELAMPPVLHRYSADAEKYRVTMTNPLTYSTPKENEPMPMPDEMKDVEKPEPKEEPKKPEDKAKDDAEKKETKGAKTDKSDVAELKEMLAPLLEVLPDLMQLVALMKEEAPPEDGKGDDLMKPADGPKPPMDDKKDMPSPSKEKGDEVVDDRKDAQPVKFDASMGSATNCAIPGFNKDKKENYTMTDDEKLKYRAEVEKELAVKYRQEMEAQKKVLDDLVKKNRKAEAEKAVAKMEETIRYRSEAERNEDIETIAALDPKSAAVFIERALERYERKLPDSTSVKEVAKYAVEGEPEIGAKTPEEAHERAMKALKAGLTMEEFYKKLAEGKTK